MPEGVLGWFTAARRSRSAGRPRRRRCPWRRRSRPPAVTLLLVARGVRMAFRGVQALDCVDLEFAAAKSSDCWDPMVRASRPSSIWSAGITGPTPADAVRGARFGTRDAHRIARVGIARTYQIPRPFAHLTVRAQRRAAGDVRRRGTCRGARPQAEAWRWLEFTGLAAQATHSRTTSTSTSANSSNWRVRSRRAAAAAAGRGAVGPDAGEINDAVDCSRDPRRRRHDRLRRACDARGDALADRLVVLDYGVGSLPRAHAAAVMAHPDVVTAFLGPRMLELRAVQVNYGAALALRGYFAQARRR